MLLDRKIDHIVYAVPNLEVAMDDLEARLGIRPTFGGYHTTKGTKNALLNLGNACYLEILAADDTNTTIPRPRWMGIDLIKTPKITRWSLKSSFLEKDSQILRTYQPQMGILEEGQRKTQTGELLVWQMILPLSLPKVEILPFMTNWQDSKNHPTMNLPESCSLVGLHLAHPQPQQLILALKRLQLKINIEKAVQPSIKVEIQSPKGIVFL